MKPGVTIFCINSGKYIYLESGGSEVYIYYNNGRNRGRCVGGKRGDEEDDQVAGIFNIIQKNPNTVVHLKVDEAVEDCTGK